MLLLRLWSIQWKQLVNLRSGQAQLVVVNQFKPRKLKFLAFLELPLQKNAFSERVAGELL